ncbi:site-specific DNA-methyltransferase [Dialister succinatiphilus]|uniref:site-specific DNA-methyltransferase n=1 Tax=Dialister succinatiphilus TaxID=487173 RepID=UPI003F7D66A9
MEKLKMHTPDLAEENYKKLAALFPDAVTETKDENGNTVRAIDKDVLMQEINAKVVDDGQERYQFTWPDKRKAVVLANAPIAKTLRFEKEKSVGRDGTPGGTDSKNIYIEGDNLDALKLLQETYLGKVKMIYIDPPYNTGNDFIYEDDFSQKAENYAENSGQTDEEGNRLVQNSESNGRFHTDWLNMLYPRLCLAKDLLANDGLIFISIDEHESHNLRKICDEIFGAQNFITQIVWEKRYTRSNNARRFTTLTEPVVCYAKNIMFVSDIKERRNEKADSIYSNPDNDPRGPWTSVSYVNPASKNQRPNLVYKLHNPITGADVEHPTNAWKYERATYEKHVKENRLYWGKNGENVYPRLKKYLFEMEGGMVPVDLWRQQITGTTDQASKELESLLGRKIFNFPKPKELVMRIVSLIINGNKRENGIILDFFSGSGTSAHAVMQLNAEDNGHRKYILMQLPAETGETSEAYKMGYKTICDIGEERIRRAGKKIKEETGADIDYGFRCFRVDSSNMKDVYYKPSDVKQAELDLFTDNIKEDRTPEDLLIQVMLDLGVLLSSKVEEEEMAGKKVFSVADGYLIACFDRDVTDDVVTAIARKHPFYAVFRDSSFSSDSVAANFEQIFDTYSPQTVRKVL